MEDLRLIDPTPSLEQEFRAMAAEWRETGDDRFTDAQGDFVAYVRKLASAREARDLPAGRVPSTTFWLLAEGRRLVGTSRLRHGLVPHLEKEGGHIGYDIRPAERRKGYGTALLGLTLDKAKDLGLAEVLVTSDSDNEASLRIIRTYGGEFLGSSTSDRTGKDVYRFRILLSD